MNNLKDQLKQELRTEAPFTEDMKQRILKNGRPGKAPSKKINWKVSVISLAFVLILGFAVMLQFTPDGATASKTVAALPTDPNELMALLQENETVLPIIESNGQLVIRPDTSYLMGKQWMLSNLPMLIEPEAEIQVGDYVAYYGVDGVNVANVYGVAGDNVQTSQRQVTLNGDFLALPGTVAPIEFENTEQQEIFKYYFGYRYHLNRKQRDYIDVELEALSTGEYAVYTNDSGHTAGVIKESQLIGKVVGIEKLEPTFTLTAEEQSLYDEFKENYDLSLLVGVEPLTITKIFLQAEMELDYETYYALFTNREGPARARIEHYIQDTRKIKDYYFTEDIQRLLSAYTFNGIERGKFEQRSENGGVINIPPTESNNISSVGMIKNEQGIWQPAFTVPIQ
ncbi:hypothetical protein AEA09_10335 [Lysinibacillus contaminans]|uniref:Signal peptidase I n=1 Tax=Lysinibacillus contaminans TaxID=1293441 RepID=A0ABR5K1Z2_9BACI|nr:hypothetical protein [Lysinibacillus contaminans]KOS68901.1 hypothetical protein AEA09_10335 [Lysinibacillus contaminans]